MCARVRWPTTTTGSCVVQDQAHQQRWSIRSALCILAHSRAIIAYGDGCFKVQGVHARVCVYECDCRVLKSIYMWETIEGPSVISSTTTEESSSIIIYMLSYNRRLICLCCIVTFLWQHSFVISGTSTATSLLISSLT